MFLEREIFLWRRWRVLSLCLAILSGLTPAARAQKEVSLTRKQRIEVFERVWSSVNERYYDRTLHGVDWTARRESMRPLAEEASDQAALYRVLRGLLGVIGDAHTRVFSPDDGFDRHRPAGLTVGVVVRPVEGEVVITWVESGSEAARQGLRPGLRVQRVDSIPVKRVLEQLRDEIGPSSTTVARELLSYERLFYGPRDTVVDIEVVNEQTESKSVRLKRRFAGFPRRVLTRRLPNEIGYIELTGFALEVERDFEAAIVSLQRSRGLIVDLRNNGGGFVSSVTRVASHFFSAETELGVFTTRKGQTMFRHTQRLRNVYLQPVVILVSARSASGAEMFAAAMQERRRALVVGTNSSTCGCLVGVSRTISLPDGGKLNVSDSDYRTANGRRVEGNGVVPDERIELRIADLIEGRDRILEWSVDYLTQRAETPAEPRLSTPQSYR